MFIQKHEGENGLSVHWIVCQGVTSFCVKIEDSQSRLNLWLHKAKTWNILRKLVLFWGIYEKSFSLKYINRKGTWDFTASCVDKIIMGETIKWEGAYPSPVRWASPVFSWYAHCATPNGFSSSSHSAEGWHDFRQEESAQYIFNKTTSVTSRVDSSIIFEWLAIQHASDVKSDD